MATYKLKPAAKILITLVIAGAAAGGYILYSKGLGGGDGGDGEGAKTGGEATGPAAATGSPAAAKRRYKVALSEWPGHMPLVIGNGGLATAPGSAAAEAGIDLDIIFIEDPVKKNAALQTGEVDFVWQVVDEMPINMVSYKNTEVEARAFLQLDWSRGGDACVASGDISNVEDILGRKAAMMKFSPDHTVFEFMINNSRLTPKEIAKVRADTSFSLDDFAFGRVMFIQEKVDVACLWEPDVTLALQGRPGSKRLFSTADATELVADVLLARKQLLDQQPEVARKVAQVWFAGVAKATADPSAAARTIAGTVPRFRDELGADGTAKAFGWVKWTDLGDNARFFGLEPDTRPAFDRVYNQADQVWSNYPDAQITDRFTPAGLRFDGVVRALWEAQPAKPEPVAPTFDKQVAEQGEAVFTKPVTINFDSGSVELDAESMHILNTQLLPQLEMAGGMYLRVEGNTDAVGNPKANQQLSEHRAQAVVDFLVGKGIAADRVSAKGNGDAHPVASNKTADGRAQNRRTDILFISSQGS